MTDDKLRERAEVILFEAAERFTPGRYADAASVARLYPSSIEAVMTALRESSTPEPEVDPVLEEARQRLIDAFIVDGDDTMVAHLRSRAGDEDPEMRVVAALIVERDEARAKARPAPAVEGNVPAYPEAQREAWETPTAHSSGPTDHSSISIHAGTADDEWTKSARQHLRNWGETEAAKANWSSGSSVARSLDALKVEEWG